MTASDGARVEFTRVLPFSAPFVWDVLGAFGELGWIPAVTRVELLGSGVGAVRRVFTASGHVDERLDSHDTAAMRYAYSIPGPMPYPVRDYRVQVRIVPNGTAACAVTWRAEFMPDGVPVADAERLMTSVYASIADWAEQELRRRLSAPA